MKNNKGFTVVELITSFSLAMIVVIFLFQLILSLKEFYVTSGMKTELLMRQANITEKINNDFINKQLIDIDPCGNNCIEFTFQDNTKKRLQVNKEALTIEYGTFKTKYVDGSNFGSLIIDADTTPNVAGGKKNSILKIKLPVNHDLISGDYGIDIVYQYDSRIINISDDAF